MMAPTQKSPDETPKSGELAGKQLSLPGLRDVPAEGDGFNFWDSEVGLTLLGEHGKIRDLVGGALRKGVGECLTSLRDNSLCLEVGSGTGSLRDFLPDRLLANWVHLERSPQLIERARERFPGGDFRQGSIYHLPFLSGVFDGVVDFNAFDTLSDLPRGLGEVRRVLKPHGKLVRFTVAIADPNPVAADFRSRGYFFQVTNPGREYIINYYKRELGVPPDFILSNELEADDHGFYIGLVPPEHVDEFKRRRNKLIQDHPPIRISPVSLSPSVMGELEALDGLEEKVYLNDYFEGKIRASLKAAGFNVLEHGVVEGVHDGPRQKCHQAFPDHNVFIYDETGRLKPKHRPDIPTDNVLETVRIRRTIAEKT